MPKGEPRQPETRADHISLGRERAQQRLLDELHEARDQIRCLQEDKEVLRRRVLRFATGLCAECGAEIEKPN